MPRRLALPKLVLALCIGLPLVGCGGSDLDTSSPQATIDTAMRLVEEGSIGRLPQLLHLDARPVTYSDGVTEASAIEDVRRKLGEMLDQLARVSRKLKERFPGDFEREGGVARRLLGGADWGAQVSVFLMDPFGFMREQRERLTAEDLGDGTAALLVDGEPVAGGFVSMVETDDGWRVTIPVELARTSEFWPDSRHEWAVIASMMLAVENSLADFEQELDAGQFRDLDHAGERVGRMLGESVVVQSLIYAAMKQSGKGADRGTLDEESSDET